VVTVALLTLLVSTACKKPASQQAAPDAAAQAPAGDPITEVAAPSAAVGEVTIADPEVFAKGVAAAGGKADIAASPYAALMASADDEAMKQVLRVVDPHAPMVVTVVASGTRLHFVVAVRATDPGAATKALNAQTDPGDRPSPSLATTIHSLAEGSGFAAVFGDAVLFADAADALESAGRYSAFRARKVPPKHQLTMRVASAKLAVLGKNSGAKTWGQLLPKGLAANVVAQVRPVMMLLLDRVAALGAATFEADAVGQQLSVHGFIPATGATSEWLTQQLKGDRGPLLTLPKGEVVAFARVPGELGPLSLSVAEVGLDSIGFEPTARAEASKQLAALGRALGREVGFSTVTETGRREVVARFQVTDLPAAKSALSALSKAIAKRARVNNKVDVVPYSKFGAIGERIDIADAKATDKDNWAWALRDSTLYVGGCLACFTSLFDAAVDPSGSGSLGKHSALTTTLGQIPSEGLLLATLHKEGSAFHVTSLNASATGLNLAGTVPLKWLSDATEALGIASSDESDEGDPPPP
jgi:hypothetical protein